MLLWLSAGFPPAESDRFGNQGACLPYAARAATAHALAALVGRRARVCTLPHQTRATWQRSLDAAAASGAHHVSVYDLQIEPRTAFGR